jgi:hypothetical protein
VYAIKAGWLSREDACKRWSIHPDELESWFEKIHRDGKAGLRVCYVTHYREKYGIGKRRREE